MRTAKIELTGKRELIALRGVVSLVLGYALLYAPDTALTGTVLAVGIVAAHLLSNALLLRLPERHFESTRFLAAMFLADLGTIAWAMSRAGNADSDFYLIFFLIVLMSGMQRDVRLSFVIGGVASLLYGVLWSKAHPLSGLLETGTMLRFPFFFIVAFFAACFVRRVQNGEHALEEARNRIAQEERLAAVGRLAGGMAHEFNGLLTAILGNASLLRDSLSPDDARSAETQDILDAGERAAAMVAHLLNFSGRQHILPARVNVRDMLEDEQNRLRRILGDAVDVRLDLASDLPPIRIDRGQLSQMLTCLASNALHATGGKGVFTIRTETVSRPERTGRFVRLHIADDGRDLPPERTAHAFEPFFSLDESAGAANLDLASVYGIVKRADGDVSVETVPGRGTQFSIDFPALEAVETRSTRPF